MDPERAVQNATRAAAQALAEGRTGDAQVLIKTAEGLTKLCSQIGPLPFPDEPWMVAVEGGDPTPEDFETYARFGDQVWRMASDLANEMVAVEPEVKPIHTLLVYRWRAHRLGPEVAARDRARAYKAGFGKRLYDHEGRLLPLPHSGEDLTRWLHAHWARNKPGGVSDWSGSEWATDPEK